MMTTLAGAVAASRGVKISFGKEKFNYVTLGDSMTTGFGFDDYYVDDDPVALIKDVDYRDEDGHKNVRGFLNLAKDSYPAVIAKYLTEKYPTKDVQVTPLATNALRVDDIYYELSGTDNTDSFYNGIHSENNNGGWNAIFAERARDKGYTTETDNNKAVTEVYQNAIKDADLITLCAGFNNFGFFLSGKIGEFVEAENFPFGPGGNDAKLQDFIDRVGLKINIKTIYTLICQIIKEEAGFDISDYEDIVFEGATIHIKRIVEVLTLATVAYLYYMNQLTNLILSLNPNVELVVVGMCNPVRGLKAKVNSLVLNLEVVVGKLFEIINLYSAIGTDKADSYKYVDVDDLYVSMHIDDMQANAMEDYQIKRVYYGAYTAAELFGLSDLLPSFDSVKSEIEITINNQYELPETFSFNDYITLRDEEIYLNRWQISEDDLLNYGGYASGIASSINNALNSYYSSLDYFITALVRATNVTELDFGSVLSLGTKNKDTFDSGELDSLLHLYTRMTINSGIWNHPNVEGHISIANRVIETLESEISAREYGLKKLTDKVNDIIEEAKVVLTKFEESAINSILNYVLTDFDLENIAEFIETVKPFIEEKLEVFLRIFGFATELLKTVISNQKIVNLISKIKQSLNTISKCSFGVMDCIVSISETFYSSLNTILPIIGGAVIIIKIANASVYFLRIMNSITNLSTTLKQTFIQIVS